MNGNKYISDSRPFAIQISQEVPAEVRVRVSLDGTAVAEVKQQVKLQPGINHITLPSEVTNPVRWMPNGWELRLCMT